MVDELSLFFFSFLKAQSKSLDLILDNINCERRYIITNFIIFWVALFFCQNAVDCFECSRDQNAFRVDREKNSQIIEVVS